MRHLIQLFPTNWLAPFLRENLKFYDMNVRRTSANIWTIGKAEFTTACPLKKVLNYIINTLLNDFLLDIAV